MKKYFILFILSVAIYFTHAAFTYHGIYGDGNGYYVYTQSIFFDHKLNSEEIYNFLTDFHGSKYIFTRVFWNQDRNPFTIGTGLLWLPALAITSLFSNNRFDITNELGCGITGTILMLGGLYFLEKYLLNFYSKRAVFWAILITFFATSVFYYTSFEPALSHQPSFFLICFLLNWSYNFKKGKLNFIILGFLSGLLAIIRPVDVILLIPIYWIVKPKVSDYIFLLSGGFIAVSPQLVNQYFQYGSVFTNLYLTGANGTWQFNLTHLAAYLFSPKRGLFLWSPVLLMAFFGLVKSRPKIFITTILILWLVTSSWSAYTSAGFGQRLSFSAIPLFAFGLAHILNKLTLNKIMLIFIVFSLWNLLLIKNVYFHKDMFIQNDNFNIKQFASYMLILD